MENTNLAKNTEIRAVSFSANTRNTPQIQLVIKLIKSSIADSRPITIDDIIATYIAWRLKYSGKKLTKEIYVGNKGGHWRENYAHVEVETEEYAKLYGTKLLARQWFKSNLASAIIKGRLLVIPVIDIE